MSDIYFTKNEIIKLEDEIDSIIKDFPLLSRQRDQALFHILLFYILSAEKTDYESKPQSKHIVYRTLYNALHHSVQWIYNFCPVSTGTEKLFLDMTLFKEAGQLFNRAQVYSDVWAMMILLHKERARVKKLKPDLFEISLNKLENRNLDTARMVIGHSDDPQTLEESSLISHKLGSYVKNKLRINYDESNSELNCSLRGDDFKRLTDNISSRERLPRMMNPDWDLGGYTFRQLRIFWTALKALCVMYKIALKTKFSDKKGDVQKEFWGLRIRIRSTDDWIKELTEITKLSEGIVKLIVSDLTQDEDLYQRSGEKKTHVMYHPFFRFGNDSLGVCERIVISANVERNAWSLMSILRYDSFCELSKEKENYWINELQNKISPLKLKSFSHINYSQKNEKGEIDLLILDEDLKFALVCELKWLTSADSASGVVYEDKEIEKGRKQAAKAIRWIESNKDALAQKIGYDKMKLRMFDFKALVISRDALGSGFIGKTDVPIINQDLFYWITLSPYQENIKTLWNIADSHSYLPKLDEHYKGVSDSIVWGNIEFHLKDISFEVIKQWMPENDIHIPA